MVSKPNPIRTSAFVRDFRALQKPGALPVFFVRGSRSLVNTRPRLSRAVREELDGLMRETPAELVRVVRGLAGGTKSAYPYVSGRAVRALRAVEPKQRPEGPLGIITTSAPYGKALERGAYYEHRGVWRRPAGRYIRRAYNRWARALGDQKVKEAMDRAIDRATKRRAKIDVEIGGR